MQIIAEKINNGIEARKQMASSVQTPMSLHEGSAFAIAKNNGIKTNAKNIFLIDSLGLINIKNFQ